MLKLKLGSLFDGISGFPLAAERNDIEPVWASEIEPFPISVSRRHFPAMKHLGDVTKINGAAIEPVDIMTFGSPCQDLSVAGARRGLEGERSVLFWEAIRIIREMRDATNGRFPTFAIWENVPGAISSNEGRDFLAVYAAFIELGAVDIAHRVLDAQFFGVPQRRRRIFLVADFAGGRAGQILFEQPCLPWDPAESGEAREEAAATAGGSAERADNCLTPWDVQSRRIHLPNGAWPALYGGEGGGHGYVAIKPLTMSSKQHGSRPGPGDQCHPLCATAHVPSVAVPQILTLHGSPVARTITARGDSSPCADRGINVIAQPAYAFSKGQSDKAYSIGWQEEVAPTLRGGQGGNQIPCAAIPQPIAFNARQDPISGEIVGTLDTFGNTHAIAFRQQRFGQYVDDDTASTAKARDHKDASDLVCAVDCRNFCENTQSATLQGRGGAGSLNYQNPVRIGYRVRRLTPTECERLQGYPDGWTEGGSDSARYKALGNSVAVPVVEWILRRQRLFTY